MLSLRSSRPPQSTQPTSINDFLPASHRTSSDEIEIPTCNNSFLESELGVQRLNDIHQWLWVAGRPMPPRSLYYQQAVRRNIVVHERMDLHLVWYEDRIFLKPVPTYLLYEEFWAEFLTCNSGCVGACMHGHLRKLANGFLLSYVSLIAYKNDLRIAKSHNLVPEDLAWEQWRQFSMEMLSLQRKRDVNERYYYGELRLSRLNKIYKFTLRAPVHGYLNGYNTYIEFWNKKIAVIAAIFVYVVVVLTAMQVGLATDNLKENLAFQRASYGFAVASIIAPLALVGIFSVLVVFLFALNWMVTVNYHKKRFTAIDLPA